jgi:hypothetical protein
MIDDDALDRALLALPLATPPNDLRAAILRATIYAPAAAFAPVMSALEIVLMGAAAAIGIWLLISILGDHRSAEAFANRAYAFMRPFGNIQTLGWLAAGMAVAGIVAMFPETRDIRIRRGRPQA